jgi:hypothetical protein
LIRTMFIAAALVAAVAHADDMPALIPLGGYSRIDVKPFVLTEDDADATRNQVARQHLEEVMKEHLGPRLSTWNEHPEDGELRVTIEPFIDEIHFVRSGIRILAGPFVRGTHLTVRLVIVEQPSGKLLGEREFEDSTSFVAATFTAGKTDNSTLTNVAEQIADYIILAHDLQRDASAANP